MNFALMETDTLAFVGLRAAIFVAVVVVLPAAQWLFERGRAEVSARARKA